MTALRLQPCRTLLSVPSSVPRLLASARASTADVVLLDLEDAVAPDAKTTARDQVRDFLAAIDSSSRRIWVRVNSVGSPEYDDDCRLLRSVGDVIEAVMIPMATPRSITAAAEHFDVPLVALIETPLSVEKSFDIADGAGVAALAFGRYDYVNEMARSGAIHATDTDWAAARIANAAAAVDTWALAAPTADVDDDALLEFETTKQLSLGYAGKWCLHPRQVSLVNSFAAPTSAQLDWALRVVEAGDARGAVRVDGAMVDKPIVDRAQMILKARS